MVRYPLRVDRELTHGAVRIVDADSRVLCEMLCGDPEGVATHMVNRLNKRAVREERETHAQPA
jgi:hypothetical protein